MSENDYTNGVCKANAYLGNGIDPKHIPYKNSVEQAGIDAVRNTKIDASSNNSNTNHVWTGKEFILAIIVLLLFLEFGLGAIHPSGTGLLSVIFSS